MTVSVRPWDQIAADLCEGTYPLRRVWELRQEAADAGDALAAVVAAVHTALEALNRIGFDTASGWEFVSAVAEAVGR